eukprot:NODE_1012_length_2224_cov_0.142118.p1 type:complete len:432 gc:universal NODE_1012_length_2224_cov_0.142118:1883-588(-)
MNGCLGIVMEYVSNNSLFHWIYQDEDDYIDEILMKSIASKIARGLAFMHEKKIAHNDIKSNNVMLDELFVPKLIDLGTVKLVDSVLIASSKKSIQNNGAVRWKAPEYLQVTMRNAKLQKEYPFSGDVYSYSILLGEMFSKELPFSMFGNDEDIKKGILDGERPYNSDMHPTIPDNILDLMEKCWTASPADRATMKSVVGIWESLNIVKQRLLKPLYQVQETASLHSTNLKASLDNYVSGKLKSLEFLNSANIPDVILELKNIRSPKDVEILKYLSSECKSSISMNLLGNWYYLGSHSLPVDYLVASDWFRKSADLKNSDAMNSLAIMYRNGEGVSIDFKTAFGWFEKSVKLGNAQAMRNLAILYESGLGCDKNMTSAQLLLEQSCSLGNESANWNLLGLYMNEKMYGKARLLCMTLLDGSNDKASYTLGVI